MLLALRYQPAFNPCAHDQEKLRTYLMLLREHHPLVLPGDPLPKKKLAICLTFDDATFEFYHTVFPLLKELKIRVLLGVPVNYILDSTDKSPEERLSVPRALMMQDEFYEKKAPFCTWEELEEMVDSGWVEVASHSYLHCNLTFNFVDLQREVVLSKEILEKKLVQPISSFIYPFGRLTLALHEFVAQHYPYAFGMGSALNFGWGLGKKPLSRISSADSLSWWNLTKAFTKALLS